jgi:dTDP-4-amino-4,6-dideoxygalactose transaminase
MTNSDIVMFKPSMAPKAAVAAAETLRGRWIGEGPKVKQFETALRDKFGMRFAPGSNPGRGGSER